MKIIFKTVGKLREIIPAEEFSLPGREMKLGQFLEALAGQLGPGAADHLLPGGKFFADYAVLVNGRNVQTLKGAETLLKDGDRVAFFTMVAGG